MLLKDGLAHLWRKARSGSINGGIFRATVLVGSFTVLAKVAAALREVIIAGNFGRSDVVDAFLIAFLLPQTVINIGGACLSASLVPVFSKVRGERGDRAAEALLTRTVFASEALFIAFSLAVGLCAPWMIHALGSNFSPGKQALTCQLCYWLLPVVPLNGFSAIVGSVLNVHRRFLVTSVTPLFTPLFTLFMIAVYGNRWGIWSLVVGTLVGYICEALIIVVAYYAYGLRFTWGESYLNQDVKAIVKQYLPLLGGGMLTGGIGLVNGSITATLPAGSVAAFAYGTKVVNVVLTVITGSLSTVLISYFSVMLAQNDWRGCQRTIRLYSRLLMAVCIPLSAAMIVFSHTMIRALYQRGAFHANDTAVVSSVQIASAIAIPFVGLGLIHVRFLSSVRRNEILLLSAVLNLILDIILGVILGRRFGVAGIALATTLFYIASCVLVIFYSRRELRRLSEVAAPPVYCESSACD